MAKALKPLVIVLLVLGVVSLILGIVLFSERDVLKTRVQKNEQGVVAIAGKLHFEGLNQEQLKKPNEMETPLHQLAVAADNQYEELQSTKKDVENAKAELGKTKTELASTKTELTDAQAKATQAADQIEQKEAEMVQIKGKADQLEQDKTTLQGQIDDLNTKLVKSDEDMRDLQDKLNSCEKALAAAEPEGGQVLVQKGLSGKIVVGNPDWNFVILDIGSDKGLKPNADMMIHREDKLVGKVHVTSVEKNMAIAEILRDWQQQPIREGDSVLF